MSDAELLTRYVREQDRSALTELVRRYENLVWSVCRRTLRNRVDVEDAFQITFLTLTANASRIRKRKNLSNWLFGVARRTSLNIRKRRSEAFLEDADEISDGIADRNATNLEAISRQNEIDLVDQQITALPERHRTPLVLKYFSGLTAKQIADQMNLSVSAVEGRLRRAKAQLRTSLRQSGFRFEKSGLGHSYEATCFGLSLIEFVSRPELILSTVSNSVTASASTIAGLNTGNLTIGIKLMICKTICVTAIAVMISAAAMLHGPVDRADDSVVLNLQTAVSGQVGLEERDTIEATGSESQDECCLDCCETCRICAMECPGYSILQSAHCHLAVAHAAIGAHVHELANWIHGTSD